jgi:hypothetical protein
MLPLLNVNLLLILILLLLSTQSCKQATEPRLEPELALTLEDVSCTEAWIQLKTNNLQLPTTINVLKNNTVAQTFSLSTKDSLLYIDSLLPNQTYKFKIVLTNNPQPTSFPQPPTSNELTITTMDTTSHNFTWQSWEFGECSNSVLYDVAIIDENNIWAVGEIYMRDSLGNCDPNAYNAVHWDGTKWELKRIYHYSSCNPVDYPPFKSIVAFSDTEIVLTSGGSIGWFNGKMNRTDCGIRPLLTGAINKLWGSSSEDLYAVGNNGNIAHWDGVRWRKIESGTTIDLLDVWGSPDGSIVWACGENSKTVLIKIQNKLAQVVFEAAFPMPRVKNRFYDGLLSLWTNNTNFIYVLTPFNLYRCSNDTRGEGKELYPREDYFRGGYLRVRGTNTNDIFTCGNKTAVWHYNGFSWNEYAELRNDNQFLSGLDYKQNIVTAVGEKYLNTFHYQALIVLGKK